MIDYSLAKGDQELQQILDLQKENLEVSITEGELQKEGYVTAHHSLDLLREMNRPFPHIIAKDKDIVIGYVLVMLKSMQLKIPVLIPMFQKINAIKFEGESLANVNYFVMGQVCIKKGYRGQGIFKGLYKEMKTQMAPYFKYIITEVATRNQRSIRAHQKVGFENLHTYSFEGEEWSIIIWKLNI